MTLAGVIAVVEHRHGQSSRLFKSGQLRRYLTRFGLGQRTDIGVTGETPGLLPSTAAWNGMLQDRIAFGQSVSVNGVQMAAAVNTIANGGVRISPSLIQGKATNNVGQTVGTDEATTRRVVSTNAAHQMTQMMERVVDPDVGVAPGAQVPGYVVAGKTGTAQRVGPPVAATTASSRSRSRASPGRQPLHHLRRGAEPAQRRRWRLGGRAGVLKIMSFALRRYGVPPTGAAPSHLPPRGDRPLDRGPCASARGERL